MASGPIRFHLDECVDAAVADGLRRRGIDVTTTAEAGLLSTADKNQLAWSTDEDRVLITHDHDFLRLQGSAVEHAGIAFCHVQSRSVGEIIRGLELIAELLEPDDMRNHVEFV